MNSYDLFRFQSPDGDFVYSDPTATVNPTGVLSSFQSPDGDFVYSDRVVGKIREGALVRVSIP